MEYFSKMKQQVSDFWQERNRAQKISMAVGAVAIIAMFGFFIFSLNKPKYVPLYSDLDTKDAGAIIKKLDEMKIPYDLEDGGTTISVHPENKYKTRLSLAQEGLPKGSSMGFEEVFNKNRLGTTDWERQVQYNQALQGELTRTIEDMAEIDKASIYIVQQEKSLFMEPDLKDEPSAAVYLKMSPGAELEDDSIKGIINLVSYAVKGLKPENVTVIDEYGRILSDISHSPGEVDKEVINNQLLIQNNFQEQLQTNVVSLLEQVFGPGNVVARVNAQLNFDQKTVQSKLFSPTDEEVGEGILRSVQEMKEHFSGTGTAPGGTPGVDGNVPGYQALNVGDSEHQRSEVIKNYDINETHENLTIAQGAVDKLTVSVVINRELNEDEKYSIAQMVGNAIGCDYDRDQVSVEGMEFRNDLADFFAGEMDRQEQRARLRKYMIFGGAALLLLLLFVLYRWNKRKKEQEQAEEIIAQELYEVGEAAAAQEDEEDLEKEKSGIYEKIEKYAHRKPEDVAKVLRTWLSEDER